MFTLPARNDGRNGGHERKWGGGACDRLDQGWGVGMQSEMVGVEIAEYYETVRYCSLRYE